MIYGSPSLPDYLSSVQIIAKFAGAKDFDPSIGTGFLVTDGSDMFLVTARHVIGENHLPPPKRTGKKLSKIDISLWRRIEKEGDYQNFYFPNLDVEFSECQNENDLAVSKLNIEQVIAILFILNWPRGVIMAPVF